MNVLKLRNNAWDITVVVVNTKGTYRVDVYSNNKLHKSHECKNIREALVKACDIVGEP